MSEMQRPAIVVKRDVPIVYEADVVVVGAGPGGFAAALQAARMGASVVLVERFDMPGGVHTSGLQGSADVGVGGIHTELMQRFAAEGYIYTATEQTHPGWAGNPLSHYERNKERGAAFTRMTFNPEGAGCVMANMLQEAGVTALYGTSFVDAIVSRGSGNDRISSIVVENASGLQGIAGKIFIEGSGTSELVARAGAPFVRGGGGQPESTGWDGIERPIPGGLLWTMNGIDFQKVAAHQETAKDPLLHKLMAEATADGALPEGVYRPRMAGKNVYGEAYIGHPTLDMSPISADGTYVLWQNVPYEWALHMDDDAADHARAKQALRGFINAEAKFLRKYVPGFENATVAGIGRFVGVRDGRHPIGEYVVNLDDVKVGRSFRDAVTRPMTKTFFWDGHRKYTFEVPFRCFLPKGIDNMILTGASLSFEYKMLFMVMRNFPWCTQTGEIAGFAAARCIERKIKPKEFEFNTPYF
ncbi:FAD-dependent oxidoreductase [Bradyrhizobium yuanmingense]|uniref:FAD-dependent oxidoreductase n=1 Tax=Bradyrhizobium yuanmingense TaxID=108015 RepID=UPI0023B96C5B|nr:FAD-dependent oxidoreductase [Bradyrhizobium yuanmingense]MDF0520202.1 FAD-dependent oxidoreductase [Bradyrhizobium yuanmingense]